jgi:hypothetical protein
MLNISPAVSMGINALLAALTAIGASSAADPTTQKVVLWAGTISSALNILLHGVSSATAGPMSSAK